MDKQAIVISLMKSTLQKILDGKFDDLCEAAAAVEVTLTAVEVIENMEVTQK